MTIQSQTQSFTFTIKPVLTHDCDCCTFLGGTVVQGQFVEYYECDDTIIARTGNEPHNNRSMPLAMIKHTLQRNVSKLRESIWLPVVNFFNE